MNKRVLIFTPAPAGSTKGNRITAQRWAAFLNQCGHQTRVTDSCFTKGWDTEACFTKGWDTEACFTKGCVTDSSLMIAECEFDCLIALHATRSYDAIVAFGRRFPNQPVILCLTGTDLHLDLKGLRGAEAQRKSLVSIQAASRIVLLEPEGLKQLAKTIRRKSVVIHQSAVPVDPTPAALPDVFEVCVVGHLRDVKDPFLTANAAGRLPPDSKILVTHCGAALSDEMKQSADKQMQTNSRYQWVGSLSHPETLQIIARSRLMVVSSKIEGAPSVISESIVNQTPVLATRIPATVGLLGSDYPGLFPVGDDAALTHLLRRAECEPDFLAELTQTVQNLAPQFSPDLERQLLEQLVSSV